MYCTRSAPSGLLAVYVRCFATTLCCGPFLLILHYRPNCITLSVRLRGTLSHSMQVEQLLSDRGFIFCPFRFWPCNFKWDNNIITIFSFNIQSDTPQNVYK